MKLGSFGMSTSHWYAVVALWFAPGAEEGHGTAQRARTYSTVWCQSRILPTGYKGMATALWVIYITLFRVKINKNKKDDNYNSSHIAAQSILTN